VGLNFNPKPKLSVSVSLTLSYLLSLNTRTQARVVSYCNSISAGFPGGNFLHILSLKTRNIIDAISSISAPNDPGRKPPVVFIEV